MWIKNYNNVYKGMSVLSVSGQNLKAISQRKEIWSFTSTETIKLMLIRDGVTSIFMYACESWTLTAELQRRIQAIEMRCYRKIPHMSYKDHVINVPRSSRQLDHMRTF